MPDIKRNEKINILLIEDNPGDARLVQALLADTIDFEVKLMIAPDLARGLKYIVAEQVNVILLDLNLPDSKGIDTFRTVHKFSMNIPIVIMSIESDKEMIYLALQEGAQDYFIKGEVENEALIRGIRYAIWSSRAA